MSNGAPDPIDQLPSPSPGGPSPSPSPNPLAPTPSTSPPQIAGTTGDAAPGIDPTQPPQDFTTWVNQVLQQRLGMTKWSLLPAADKKALIAKLWQDPSIENYYSINHKLLSGGDATALVTMRSDIQSVLYGQGNDPSVVIDYTNLLQSAGVTLTVAEQQGLAGAAAAVNAPVPKPFSEQTVSGYDYGAPMPAGGWSPDKAPGQSFGWDKHYGVDYGTRAGERIVSPFAGVAHVQTGVPGYGNYVTVTLDNGWTIGFGHVASGAVQDGARVNPGDLVAIAGANVGDSTGAVTIVTWQNPQGQYENPHDVLDPIFGGATFSSLGAAGAAGTGMPTVDKLLDTEYPSIKSDWQTYFGTPPSPEDVYNVLQHGNSPAEWSDYIRAFPSHLDGLTQGQYYDLRSMADKVSTQVLGHPATDGIVSELSSGGLTSQQAVLNWYNEHGVTGIDQSTYQDIYKANQPTMQNIFNEPAGADPRDIKSIHDSQQNSDQVGFTPQ